MNIDKIKKDVSHAFYRGYKLLLLGVTSIALPGALNYVHSGKLPAEYIIYAPVVLSVLGSIEKYLNTILEEEK